MSDVLTDGVRWLRNEAELAADAFDDCLKEDRHEWVLADEIERLRGLVERVTEVKERARYDYGDGIRAWKRLVYLSDELWAELLAEAGDG